MTSRGRSRKTAKQFQQDLASWSGAGNITSWDIYTPRDYDYLIKKLKLLIPDYKNEKNPRLAELRRNIASAAWNQRKYNGGDLLMSIIYVVYTKYEEDETDALESTEYAVYSLLRVRKCRVDQRSDNCCMIFIDNEARVYQNWEDYIDHNKLPEGVLVVPRNGCYKFDEDDDVLLQCVLTPAALPLAKVGNAVDVAAGVTGVGLTALAIAGLFTPLTAPLAVGATIAGMGSGIWGVVSSASRLADRAEHEESIDLSDAQARAEWFGIAGSIAGMGASRATAAMAKSAAQGARIPSITRGFVNGLNATALLLNGVSIGDSTIQIITDLENRSAIDVVRLSTSLFLLTHSAYNFRTASRIINNSRGNTIGKLQNELTRRQRKAFNRMYRETVALHGEDAGRVDVLRALNSMPESRQPLNDINKINRQLNQNNLRASFYPDGRILLNNDLVVDSAELRQNLQHGIGENIAQRVAGSTATNNYRGIQVPDGSIKGTSNRLAPKVKHILKAPTPESVFDEAILIDTINNISEYISPERLEDLYTIANKFWKKFSRKFGRELNRFIPLEEVLWRCFLVAKEECEDGDIAECIEDNDTEFFIRKLKRMYENLIPEKGTKIKCRNCRGYYYIL